MTSSVESQVDRPISNNEHVSKFTQITDKLRHENPELFDDVNAVLHLNAELDRSGLATDRMEYLTDERGELIDQLLQNPEQSILAEVGLLARNYRGRIVQGVDYDGTETVQFVTRDPERMKADLHFRIVEFPSGRSKVAIEVPVRDNNYASSEPFFITIDSEDGLSIQQRVYERGEYRYKQLDPTDESGRERIWQFFTHSITATDLVDNRSQEEIHDADSQAHKMLIDKILHG